MARDVKIKITGDDDGSLRKALGDAEENIKGFGGRAAGHLGGLLSTMGKIGGVLAGGLALGGGKLLFDAVGSAGDLAETTSKVGVLFGEASGDIEAFAATAAKSLGQTKQEAMDASATFAVIGKSAGLSGKDLAGFATGLTTLASDMASFSNATPQEAIDAIGAALRGESEPIRRFGVMLDDASVKAEALSLGLVKGEVDTLKLSRAQEAAEKAGRALAKATAEHGAESQQATDAARDLEQAQAALADVTSGSIPDLTAQQKVMARQSLIMRQTSDAQGDFARTSGGLANQQRILKAQLKDTVAELGTKLLPIAAEVVSFVNANLVPTLSRWAGVLGNVLGPAARKIVDAGYAFADGWSHGSAVVTGGGLLGAMAGFGETVRRIAGWIRDDLLPALARFGGWVREEILPRLVEFARWTRDELIPALGKLAGWIRDEVVPVLLTLADWFSRVSPAALVVRYREDLIPAMQAVAKWVREDLVPAIQAVAAWIRDDLIPAIAGVVGWFRDEFGPKVRELVDLIAEKLGPTLRDTAAWFREDVQPAVRDLTEKLGELWRRFERDILPTVKDVAEVLGTVLFEALKGVVRIVFDVVIPAMRDFWSVAFDVAKILGDVALKAWDIASAVTDGISGAIRKIKDLGGDIAGAAAGVGSALWDAGRAVIDGFIRGMAEAWHLVLEWIGDKMSMLPEPVRKALGMKSPSKVFAELGRNTMAGFRLGLEAGAVDVADYIAYSGAPAGDIGALNVASMPSGLRPVAGGGAGGQRPMVVQVMLDRKVLAQALVAATKAER